MLVQTARQNVRKLVDAYARQTGDPVAVISKKVYGNRAFLEAFLAGEKSITLDKLESMVNDFRQKWPTGLRWPKLQPIPMDRAK